MRPNASSRGCSASPSTAQDYERGAEFVRGVVERAGVDGLNRLWERAEMEPTPNELVAPGLWLARIDLA